VRRRSTRAIIDACGVLILGLEVGVAALRGHASEQAVSLVGFLLMIAGSVVIGRWVGGRHRGLIPAAVAAIAIAIAIAVPQVVTDRPLDGPFGYRNATGAFYVQATIAAIMVSATRRRWPLRVLGVSAAILFGAVAVKDSSAAAVSLVASAVALLVLGGTGSVRVSIATAAALFLLVLIGTILVGAAYQPETDGGFLTRVLTERRLVLWHESLRIVEEHPTGVGPGRFGQVDPTALRDPDARWAHNEFLQQGVELGWAGLALAVLLFLWGFARLWVHPAPDILVALGAISLAALGIQASVDYILHFPGIPLAGAALLGTAQSIPLRRSRRDHDDARKEDLESHPRSSGIAGAQAAG
jgi:O-antigen ligase